MYHTPAARECPNLSKQDSVRTPDSPELAAAMADTHWEGSLRADRCCASRFGNPSKTHLSDLHLDISAEGPGPLEHAWHHGEDHSLCLQVSATLAGERCGPLGAYRPSDLSLSLGVLSFSSIECPAGCRHACF